MPSSWAQAYRPGVSNRCIFPSHRGERKPLGSLSVAAAEKGALHRPATRRRINLPALSAAARRAQGTRGAGWMGERARERREDGGGGSSVTSGPPYPRIDRDGNVRGIS